MKGSEQKKKKLCSELKKEDEIKEDEIKPESAYSFMEEINLKKKEEVVKE